MRSLSAHPFDLTQTTNITPGFYNDSEILSKMLPKGVKRFPLSKALDHLLIRTSPFYSSGRKWLVTETAVAAWCEYHQEWIDAFRPRIYADGSRRPKYFGAVLSYNALLDDPFRSLEVLDEVFSVATFKKSTICNPSCFREASAHWKQPYLNSTHWINLQKSHTSTSFHGHKETQLQVSSELKTDFGRSILNLSQKARLLTNSAFLNRGPVKTK